MKCPRLNLSRLLNRQITSVQEVRSIIEWPFRHRKGCCFQIGGELCFDDHSWFASSIWNSNDLCEGKFRLATAKSTPPLLR